MIDAGAQNLQAAPGAPPDAPAPKPEPVGPTGEALFNPFGTLGVAAPAHAASPVTPSEVGGWGATVVALVAAAAVVRLLRRGLG